MKTVKHLLLSILVVLILAEALRLWTNYMYDSVKIVKTDTMHHLDQEWLRKQQDSNASDSLVLKADEDQW